MNDEFSILIRDEVPGDRDGIRAVTIDAFADSEFGYNGEADLIDVIRDSTSHLSLVAVDADEVVGHIFFSPVHIRSQQDEFAGMGLGPMSVAPKRQGQGIGAALVSQGLERLKQNGCSFVVVLGHPEYYTRFGFVPAAQLGISHGFAGIHQEVFFVHQLGRDALTDVHNDQAFYHSAFGPQHHEK